MCGFDDESEASLPSSASVILRPQLALVTGRRPRMRPCRRCSADWLRDGRSAAPVAGHRWLRTELRLVAHLPGTWCSRASRWGCWHSRTRGRLICVCSWPPPTRARCGGAPLRRRCAKIAALETLARCHRRRTTAPWRRGTCYDDRRCHANRVPIA